MFVDTTPRTLFDVPDSPVHAARRRYGRPGPKWPSAELTAGCRPPRRQVLLPADEDWPCVPDRLADDPPWAGSPERASFLYDNQGEPIPFEPRQQFLRRLAGIRRRVALTTRFHRGAGVWISTVFLGVDIGLRCGPPVLWETMLFTGDPEQGTVNNTLDPSWRYSSVRAAVAGHAQIVDAISACHAAHRLTPRRTPRAATTGSSGGGRIRVR